MNKILPSLMSQTQAELDQDLKHLKGAAKTLHLDVVDGKFAQNKTFQFPFKLPKTFQYQVHLMIQRPDLWINQHGKKFDLLIFHPETLTKHQIQNLIKKIKSQKKKVGFALKPETKVKDIQQFLPDLDYILILTVHPGFYGSKFLPKNLKKIKQIKKLNKKIKIIVDGGLNPKTIKRAKEADFFVSGSYTTKATHPPARIKNLLKALK